MSKRKWADTTAKDVVTISGSIQYHTMVNYNKHIYKFTNLIKFVNKESIRRE